MKIAVVGGGVVGVTTCYELLKNGHEVTLFEKNSEVANECSYSNGGQLSVCNTPVWNYPLSLAKATKYLFQKNAPLQIDWSWNLDKYSWLMKFVGNAAYSHFNYYHLLHLGLASRWRIHEIARDEKLEFDYGRGILKVYKNKLSRKDMSIPDTWEIIKSKNYLPGFDGGKLGLLFPYDGFGDAYKFTKGLLEVCKKNANFKVLFDKEVTSIESNVIFTKDSGLVYDFDRIVLSASLASAWLGGLSIYPVKGYSLTIHNVKPEYQIKCSILDDDHKIVATPLGNDLRIAGIAHISDYDRGDPHKLPHDKFQMLMSWVKDNLPDIRIVTYSEYTCCRPMTPSMVPVIGPSKKNPNLFYNTGHGHLGWTLACGSAQQVARDIVK